MISFRYHIVSIVSVFLALAVGVALGSGPLKGGVDDTLVKQVEADKKAKSDLRAEITSLQQTNGFTDEFADRVAPSLIGGALSGRPVTLLVMPDAQQSTVTSLTKLVQTAGGSVAGTIRATDRLLDVGNKQLVDELSSQLLDGVSGVTVPADAGPYERLGAVLGRAVATTQDTGAPVDDAANSILAGLSTAKLMSPAGDLTKRGSLVLVVTGAGPENTQTREAAGAVITSMAGAMDQASDGVVVAGPNAAAHGGGAVEAVRQDVQIAQKVSTVDSLERAAGQVVAIMALREQAGGGAGHYGSVDAPDGVMPSAASD